MNASFALPLGLPPLPPELAALGAHGPIEVNPNDIVRQAFRIGHMRLLAPFAIASELTEMPNVFPLPRMPAHRAVRSPRSSRSTMTRSIR